MKFGDKIYSYIKLLFKSSYWKLNILKFEDEHFVAN